MSKPWTAYIHLGIVHPMAFPETLKGEGPIIETVTKILRDPFFGAIEVSWVKDEVVRAQLASLLEAAHIDTVYCGGPPILMQGLNLNALDPNERSRALDGVKKLVDEAYALNAKILLVCSGRDPGVEKRDEAKNVLIDSLKEVCGYAEERAKGYALSISLENFDRDVDKRLLIGPTSESVEVAKAVRESYENFGLTVDLSHLPLLKESSREALSSAKDYLIHVHVGNCVVKNEKHPLYGDQHPRFGITGGENDVKELAEFLKVLKDVGYLGKKTPTALPVVSFEVKPTADEVPEVVIAGSKRVFLDAWAMVE